MSHEEANHIPPTTPMATVPTFKIVLVGDAMRGKTSTLLRALNGTHNETYVPTMTADVRFVTLRLLSGSGEIRGVRLEVWDTPGQERFGGVREAFLLQAQAAVVFVSAPDEATKREGEVRRWGQEVYRATSQRVPMYVAHSIPPGEERVWRGTELGDSAAKVWGGRSVGACLISARTGLNVMMPFVEVAKHLLTDETLTLVV